MNRGLVRIWKIIRMRIEKFEDLLSWQKSQYLAKMIYSDLNGNKDFGFRDQIFRASVSISNNLAEGFGRQSKNQLAYFLRISIGSCMEVKSMLYLAEELNYIDSSRGIELRKVCDDIIKLIGGFLRSILKNH